MSASNKPNHFNHFKSIHTINQPINLSRNGFQLNLWIQWNVGVFFFLRRTLTFSWLESSFSHSRLCIGVWNNEKNKHNNKYQRNWWNNRDEKNTVDDTRHMNCKLSPFMFDYSSNQQTKWKPIRSFCSLHFDIPFRAETRFACNL